MLRKLALIAVLLAATTTHVLGQAAPFQPGFVQGNSGSASAPGKPTDPSAIFDRKFGSTRGSILERGSSGWVAVVPSVTAGLPWVSNGTGADPAYQALGIAGGGTNCTAASGTCLDNITGFSSTGYPKRTGAGAYSFNSTIPDSDIATQSNATVLANVSGSTAAPSPIAPQALNQGGFTGMAPCGYTLADNAGPNFNAGAVSSTQIIVNQVSLVVLCQASAWVSQAWYADNTAAKVTNIVSPGFSTNHRLIDVTLQAGVGGCTATGVSDETHPGCNDVGAPCHVASTPTECNIFIVSKTTTPGTVNDVGFVISNRIAPNGPSATVQAVYPFYAPYMRNYTTGGATFGAETFRWFLAKLGSLHTILGDTTVGFGRFTAVASGSTASAFTAMTIPTGFISPNSKNVEFTIINTGAASSLCGVSPYAAPAGTNWTTVQLDWPNNPGLTNLAIKSGLMGTSGSYGYVSSVAGCIVYVTAYTDSYGGVP